VGWASCSSAAVQVAIPVLMSSHMRTASLSKLSAATPRSEVRGRRGCAIEKRRGRVRMRRPRCTGVATSCAVDGGAPRCLAGASAAGLRIRTAAGCMLVHRGERRRVNPVSPVLARASPIAVCVRPCAWVCRGGTEESHCMSTRPGASAVCDGMGADDADGSLPASPSASARVTERRGAEPGSPVAILSIYIVYWNSYAVHCAHTLRMLRCIIYCLLEFVRCV
jgi:hypothetical protein